MADYPYLHEHRSWKGSWWLPESPEMKFAGFLDYDPGEGLTLSLVGGFDDRVTRRESDEIITVLASRETFPVIHGSAQGLNLTLFDAFATGSISYGLGFFDGPSEQTITANALLVGVHAPKRDDLLFEKVVFGISDLWRWCAQSAATATLCADKEGSLTGAGTVSIAPVEPLTAQFTDASVTLSHTLRLPHLDVLAGGARGRTEDRPVMSVKALQVQSLDMLLESVWALKDLVSLGVGRGCAVQWLRLYLPPPDPDAPLDIFNQPAGVDVYLRVAETSDPEALVSDPYRMVFTLADQQFEDLIPRWEKVRTQFRTPCNILLAPSAPGGYVENRVTMAVTAAESFHKGLGEEPKETRTDKITRLEPARAVLPDADWKWLCSMVPGGFSLKQRLRSLADRLPSTVRPLILPDVEAWVKAAAAARNDLSHAGQTQSDLLRLHAVASVTRAVVLLNILSELGLDEENLATALERSAELENACQQAHKNFPAAPINSD
ncbi:HEPN domain-containing protein [Acidipropionibacterium thoenii]|uniref:ApeA N-terminal domain 1-containing protein n=1 Tax=Acidipropionibacterium thoenii TaxID=1751 RepID=UPI00040A5FC9|nr:HEPN domain-containing protein [Acidipropionibacterium thoenii]